MWSLSFKPPLTRILVFIGNYILFFYSTLQIYLHLKLISNRFHFSTTAPHMSFFLHILEYTHTYIILGSLILSKVWPVCIGNALSITEDLYEIFRDRARIARANEDLKREQLILSRKQSRLDKTSSLDMTVEKTNVQKNVKKNVKKNVEEDDTSVSKRSKGVTKEPIQNKQNIKHVKNGHARVLTQTLNIVSPQVLLGREETINRIQVDLPRTFPQLAFFVEGSPLHQALRDVLEA